MKKSIWLAAAIVAAGLHASFGQLAITEIMTQESATNTLGKGPDWWELSNYGNGDIDLTGYRWNDDAHGGALGADTSMFTGVIIHAGESIVITETNKAVPDAATFRQWWGIGAGVQVLVCPASDPGLSQTGDEVRLWGPGAAAATEANDFDNLVDRVTTGAAPLIMVPTFTYDPNNGTFDWLSTNGVRGAFQAATSDEVGSPGVKQAAGPIVITQQPGPKSQTLPAGVPFTYTVSAIGMPKPRFIWLRNGAPVDTNALGAVISFAITNNQSVGTLSFPGVQSVDNGTYSVIVSNGILASVASSNATLTVTSSPLAPQIASAPQDLWAYPGQSAVFTVDAFGSPSPTLQWKRNGVNLPGETGPQLSVPISDTNAAGVYSVAITNSAGTTNASALLTITAKPNLRITEVMSSENGTGHQDWWELSNLGAFPVNLHGFRFDDSSFSLAAAYTITNNLLIAPNESVVLVEDMSAQEFTDWWGADQLPPSLQIISYHGAGLSLSSAGDSLTVWNAAAGTESDYLDSVSFDAAATGDSFTYDPASGGFAGSTNAAGGISVTGYDGAFLAATNSDIGSPGYIVNTPRFTEITRSIGGAALTWVSQPSLHYAIQYKNSLSDANWATLTTVTAAANTNLQSYTDSTAPAAQRFYRLILNP
ncbi:MAG: lamin tail domain-containing protein [Verrucomicrobiota bacterium]